MHECYPIHTYTHTHITHMHTYAHIHSYTHTHITHMHTYAHIHPCTHYPYAHLCTHTPMHTLSICTPMHTYTHAQIIHMHTYAHIRSYTHAHITHVHTYAHTYTHAYITYMHTGPPRISLQNDFQLVYLRWELPQLHVYTYVCMSMCKQICVYKKFLHVDACVYMYELSALFPMMELLQLYVCMIVRIYTRCM